ncbi:NAD(P)-dependent oxidoreductase [Bradyrhizobium ganzhouense]|uniref:NAD(P)-dependent oxidoreductase n=1 Tax=Bradyrhizobium ganzhouense TaxID=1179767 RepID=UPI003CEAB69E
MAGLTIGFLGTGIMGAPMAGHLAMAGHRVLAWNRTPQKVEALPGVERVEAPAAAAQGADAVVVMLSSGPVCDEILLGPEGALASMAAGAALVVMSSIPVETARSQAEAAAAQSVLYLDAPVSGGEKGARDATLSIMAGGSAHAFKRVLPLLEVMGRPTHVGPVGTGQLAKLVNQMIVASTIATVAEAMLFAERGGADSAKVREALLGGFADSTILRQHALRMINCSFAPGGPAKYQVKDTGTALSYARRLGLELPVLRLVDALFSDMVANGDGDLDHSAIIREIGRRNGIKRG